MNAYVIMSYLKLLFRAIFWKKYNFEKQFKQPSSKKNISKNQPLTRHVGGKAFCPANVAATLVEAVFSMSGIGNPGHTI